LSATIAMTRLAGAVRFQSVDEGLRLAFGYRRIALA
jgi:hypothetical protein